MTIILFDESNRGEVKADFSIVPVVTSDVDVGVDVDVDDDEDDVDDDDDDDEVDEVEEEDDSEVGELAGAAVGEVDADEVDALEMADDSDELLSDKLEEPKVRLLPAPA